MILPSGFFIVVGQGTLSCPGDKQAKSLSKGAKSPLPGLLNP